MKIRFLAVGKTDEGWLREAVDGYEARIRRYVPFSVTEIPALKNAATLSPAEQNAREGALILRHFGQGDLVYLLDERGREMRSVEFAGFLNRQFLSGGKTIWFVAGGPYGFDPSVKKLATGTISLSKMTFSHQMVRLFFAEQLYRALTIIRGEPYHHE